MSVITLDDIKATQQKLAQMIASFEQQPTFPLTIERPDLNEGETYIGSIVSANGAIRKNVILLPGENKTASWQEQMEWAKSIGGELPDRVEGALLFALLKDEFKPEGYWTREQLAADSVDAWAQWFDYGGQDFNGKDLKLLARAVRSEPIR